MAENRRGSHTVYNIQYHFVWVTKYRHKVLRGEVAERARELIRQSCMSRDIKILKGHVSRDHVHLLLSSPPSLSPSNIAQYLKGRSSHLLQQEFSHLKKRYWGQHLWARGYFCSTWLLRPFTYWARSDTDSFGGLLTIRWTWSRLT